MYNIKQLQ